MTTQSEFEPISYNIVFFDKRDQPLFTQVMQFTDYWTACTSLLEALPEDTAFDVRDMDGNIPAI